MVYMSRTNVVIDDELVARVKERYGLRTTREAIDFALRAVAGTTDQMAMLDMQGTGWEGDLAEMRGDSDESVALVAESDGPRYDGAEPGRAVRKSGRPKGSVKRPGNT